MEALSCTGCRIEPLGENRAQAGDAARFHGAAQKSDLSDFMRAKLKHSQLVLEGLVLGDFDRIAKNAQDMSLLTLAENWQVLQTPQYIEYSRKFRAAADALDRLTRR